MWQGRSKLDNCGGGLIFIYSCSTLSISFEIDCFYGHCEHEHINMSLTRIIELATALCALTESMVEQLICFEVMNTQIFDRGYNYCIVCNKTYCIVFTNCCSVWNSWRLIHRVCGPVNPASDAIARKFDFDKSRECVVIWKRKLEGFVSVPHTRRNIT